MNAPTCLVRRLVPSDAARWQALRLFALRDTPSAFCSSYEEECDTALATVAAHLAPDSGRNRFGVFAGTELVGVVAIGRESARKLAHKAFVAGMYVAPDQRGKGLGKLLLEHALEFALGLDGVRQINLTLTAGNAAALALYESLGFVVYGCEPDATLVDGVLYDQILMARVVSASASVPVHT